MKCWDKFNQKIVQFLLTAYFTEAIKVGPRFPPKKMVFPPKKIGFSS